MTVFTKIFLSTGFFKLNIHRNPMIWTKLQCLRSGAQGCFVNVSRLEMTSSKTLDNSPQQNRQATPRAAQNHPLFRDLFDSSCPVSGDLIYDRAAGNIDFCGSDCASIVRSHKYRHIAYIG